MKEIVDVKRNGKKIGTVTYEDGKVSVDIDDMVMKAIVEGFMDTPMEFGDENVIVKAKASGSPAIFQRFCLQLWKIGLDGMSEGWKAVEK